MKFVRLYSSQVPNRSLQYFPNQTEVLKENQDSATLSISFVIAPRQYKIHDRTGKLQTIIYSSFSTIVICLKDSLYCESFPSDLFLYPSCFMRNKSLVGPINESVFGTSLHPHSSTQIVIAPRIFSSDRPRWTRLRDLIIKQTLEEQGYESYKNKSCDYGPFIITGILIYQYIHSICLWCWFSLLTVVTLLSSVAVSVVAFLNILVPYLLHSKNEKPSSISIFQFVQI